jgi:RNA-directed DNA polymerase
MSREANSTLAASSWMGARNDGMRNVCELLINVVIVDRPKMLTGLDQKVRGVVGTVRCCPTRTTIPPANRQTLTHRVKLAEQGKPNHLHDRYGKQAAR